MPGMFSATIVMALARKAHSDRDRNPTCFIGLHRTRCQSVSPWDRMKHCFTSELQPRFIITYVFALILCLF